MAEETWPLVDHFNPVEIMIKQVSTVTGKWIQLVEKLRNIEFFIYNHQRW
jgi:hypothetical protein